jgi:type I restriction enzyme R subunit
MRTLNEDAIEYAANNLFSTELGYAEIIWGPDIAPEGARTQERDYHEVVLRGRLEAAIARLNPHLPSDARADVLRKALRAEFPDPLSNNFAFHRLLTEGVDVTFRNAQGEIRTDKAMLLDFAQPDRNEFVAVRQLTVIENGKNRRADTVIYVNGLPLVLLEFKNPADPNATLKNAWNQVQTYQKDLPSLFQYNAFCVIGDGIHAKAGTISSEESRYMAWKSTDGRNLVKSGLPDQETLLRGMLNKKTLLELVRHFIVFEETQKKTIKKIAAYHQYYAVNKAIHTTIGAASENGNKQGGVVWHTQGSGKSLSMVFYAGKLVLAPEMENPTLVVLTDRNDLDQQLFGTFSACRVLLRQTPKQAESRDHLRELLAVASGGIVFTTIQKFLETEAYENEAGETKRITVQYPTLSTRRNIVVMADEAHRSQYDFIDGFARNMRDAMPNATFLGFTGTPVEKSDANTRAVFGEYVDIYDIKRAVDDGATVPIYYESRLAHIKLDKEQAAVLDEKINALLENFSEKDEEASLADVRNRIQQKAKWARVEAVVSSEGRVKQVAADIVQHFEQRREVTLGKAMIVCISRQACVAMYEALKALRPDWHAKEDGKGGMKVVMTGSASDTAVLQTHIRTKTQNETIANRFKDEHDPLQIVIVRDMWLTGFDVPCLDTLYVDKPMSGHNLMQAIARTNRVFKNKGAGVVVDYIGILYDLKQALENYIENGGEGKPANYKEEAVEAMRKHYERVKGMFAHVGGQMGFPYDFYFHLDKANLQLEFIARAANYILQLENGKQDFREAVYSLLRAFAIAIPDEAALAIRDEVKFFQAVRAYIIKVTVSEQEEQLAAKGAPTSDEIDSTIRQMVSKAILPQNVIDLFAVAGVQKPDISFILSEDFLRETQKSDKQFLLAEIVRKLLNDEIKSFGKSNLVKGKEFSRMLQESVNRYQNHVVSAAQFVQELIDMAKGVNKAKHRGEELGLTEGEVAFYDALETNDDAVKVLGDDILKKIALDLYKNFRENASIDWSVKESVRAKLRVSIKRVLKMYGYPPDKTEAAVKLVLEQAEMMAGLG